MLDILAKTPLFRGIVRDDIRVVLKSLCAHEKSYRKGEIIVQAGATTRECGVVVRGAAVIEHGDIWGNVSIMGVIEVGVNFALPYACLGSEPLPFTVVAREATSVVFIDVSALMTTRQLPCHLHSVLMRNLLEICARRNLHLVQRSMHTAPKTIRGRIVAYLSDAMSAQKSRTLEIPYNRQQLAQYLGVERSALSNELSKMQKEGILRCEKNVFTWIGTSPMPD